MNARPEVAQMPEVPLPRMSGELVFHDEWERRAFAIADWMSPRSIAAERRFTYRSCSSAAFTSWPRTRSTIGLALREEMGANRRLAL